MPANEQRMLIDSLNHLNAGHLSPRFDNSNLAARIASYELAYKMQTTAPEAIDLDSESEETKSLYGLDDKKTEDFGRKCLMARRLVERGVRYIQVYSGGAHNDQNWDAHGDLEINHNLHAGETDKPIAGLLKDLKRRGMLDETLIVWGGEFGRQPTAEYAKGTGRDHKQLWFYHVDGRGWCSGRNVDWSNRRTRIHGGGKSLSCQAPPRHSFGVDGARSQSSVLFLRRTRSSVGRS